ncbi:hypothetical protein ACFWB0_19280 [Rhodococcus sp. NPDC060086]|uniref:hypothetical protein n=1 Tax=unclassified Rhodococcus (in: high G+C Gram-positive bacteria) TaxID=192944 RepID=UPI00365EE4D2
MKLRTRVIAAAVIAAATLTAPATAGAEELPDDGPTITMTIANTTDAPMIYAGERNEYGRWVDKPATVIAAHATTTVSAVAADRRGFGIQVTYTMPGDGHVTLMSSNYGTGPANADGTRIDGGNEHRYSISSHVDTGFPFMKVAYTVARP